MSHEAAARPARIAELAKRWLDELGLESEEPLMLQKRMYGGLRWAEAGRLADAFSDARDVVAGLLAIVTAAQWQPIETAPTDKDVWFYIVPKTAEETYRDTSGRPIVSTGKPYVELTRFGRWGSLLKATHWMPSTKPSPPRPEPPA